MVFVAPYRYVFDLGAHGSAELELPGGGRRPRPYFGYFGVGNSTWDRGTATADGVEIRCSQAELDRWSTTEATCLTEVRGINADLLRELDTIRAHLGTPRGRRARSRAMALAARRSEEAVARCYGQMMALADRYRHVWQEVNQAGAPLALRWSADRPAVHETVTPPRQWSRELGNGTASGGATF